MVFISHTKYICNEQSQNMRIIEPLLASQQYVMWSSRINAEGGNNMLHWFQFIFILQTFCQ